MVRSINRIALLALAIVLALALVWALVGAAVFVRKQNARAIIGVGYKVKITCSEVFVAKRNLDDVLATQFFNIDPLMDKIKISVDTQAKTVTGHLYGLGKSMAVYREGAGCTVFAQHGVEAVNIPVVSSAQKAVAHTYETAIKPEVQTAVQALFDESALPNPIVTRGVVVIQDGKIVAEHYRDGFTKDTPQQSWSMAKAVTQSLIGIMSGHGWIALDDTALLPHWQGDDPRAKISLDDLLHMASGLEFLEEYANTDAAVVQMLFNRKDMGAYASSFPLIRTPGTQSKYSSGTTNIVSKIIRIRLDALGEDYHAFPRRALFDKLGMMNTIFEVDPNGGFIGSSYIYATPRDFARFGQFILQDGVWEEERILPEGWVNYSRQPGPGDDQYASHWMVNTDQKSMPGLPADILYIIGNDGQYIITIPSKNTVIVRLGVTRSPATLGTDVLPLLRNIYNKL
ncbi:MAG: 6-aminohexanoate hydrolase [Robiginitomaculum sp.]|nr:MAG: 6-aminohexanoate hydrolase [Robiginitomaculum sp.]